MKKSFPLVVLLLALVGCASTPSTKAVVTDERYTQDSQNLYGMETCGMSGRMPLELVARGRSIVWDRLKGYAVSPSRMGKEVQFWRDIEQTVPDEWCKGMTVNTLQIQQETELKRQKSAARSTDTYDPVRTNCVTYFGQTSCTSH